MKIIIIGATGTIGSEVVKALLQNKHEVVRASRNGEVKVNLDDPASIRGLFDKIQGVDAVVGFSAPEDINAAVCVLPGTELSFAYEVKRSRLWPWNKNIIHHKTAIFRQVNLDRPHAHHDALEFPDGEIVLLTYLMEGQQATVLQLPAAAVGSKAPQRAVYV